MTRRRKDFA